MTDNPPSEDRSVRGNDINPATIGGREPVELISTGEVNTDRFGLTSDTYSINDDSVVKIKTSTVGFYILVVNELINTSAVVSSTRDAMVDLSSSGDFTVLETSTELNGTTGADGDVTVARFFNEFAIENRAGEPITVDVWSTTTEY